MTAKSQVFTSPPPNPDRYEQVSLISHANAPRLHVSPLELPPVVSKRTLSIAIGKSGQNVRLASKLTGFELDIEAERTADSAPQTVEPAPAAAPAPAKAPAAKLKKKSELESDLLSAIEEHGE